MTDTTPTRLPAADRLRLERYLLRFSWHMQDYPQRQERAVRRDLRREIRAAAADVGMTRALADLGHPHVLAEGYITALGRRLPRWTSGAVAATLAVAFLAYLGLAYGAGTLDTLEALGGGTLTTRPLGAPTTFTVDADTLAVDSRFSWQGAVLFVGVAAVAFVLGSRPWRLLG